MSQIYKFTFHSDAGHGWIECPLSLLILLGIQNKISRYSYLKYGSTAFLEEDCDASLLVDTLKNQGHSVEFEDKSYDGQCFIRNLPRF